jgi:hypothetical protein
MKLYPRRAVPIVPLVLLWLSCFCAFSAEQSAGINVIYVLDVSASMNRGGLFENIKSRLKQLVDERDVGDRVTLLTFGEEVSKIIDVEIRNRRDIEEIKGVIGSLKANGPWTWMSQAFQRTRDMAADVETKQPGKRIAIYLLTDCENDPPPTVKKAEPPWKFVEVLIQYFKDFKVQDTHVYLLSYGHLDRQDKERIAKETPITLKEPEATEPIPFRIVLALSDFDFGQVDVAGKEDRRSGAIIVKKIEGTKAVEKILLSPPPSFVVDPEYIECEKEGEKHQVSITIPAGLDAGQHIESIKLSAFKGIVEPSRIDFSFIVKGASGNLAKWLMFVVILLCTLFLIALAIRRQRTKQLWAKTENGEVYEILLRGQQKLWLSEHPTGEYVECGLRNCFVTLGKNGSVMLCDAGNGERRKTHLGKEMLCNQEGGKEVRLTFYDKDPSQGTKASEAEERTDRPKGPMGDI